MKSIATAFAFVVFSGPALAGNTLPCSLLQLWVTSLPTVPADHNKLSAKYEVSIASVVLRKPSTTETPTRVAQATTGVKNL